MCAPLENVPRTHPGCALAYRPSLRKAGTFRIGNRYGARNDIAQTLVAGNLRRGYQWDSSRDYNASPGLERIQARLLGINSADDERNPPELGIMEHELRRVKNGRLLLIPGSDQTAGHGTAVRATWWKQELAAFLQSAPRRGK